MSHIRVNVHTVDDEENKQPQVLGYTTYISFEQLSLRRRRQRDNPMMSMLSLLLLHMDNDLEERIEYAIQESMEYYRMEKKDITIDVTSIKYREAKCSKVETNCTICCDDFIIGEDVSLLECKHLFHHKCIMEWGMYKPECPVCRERIEVKI